MLGPDHAASLEFDELKKLIEIVWKKTNFVYFELHIEKQPILREK